MKIFNRISKQAVRAFFLGGLVATILTTVFFRFQIRKIGDSVAYLSDARTENDLTYLTPIAQELLKNPDERDVDQVKWHLRILLGIAVNRAQESERKSGVIPGLSAFGKQSSLLSPQRIAAAEKAVQRLEKEGEGPEN